MTGLPADLLDLSHRAALYRKWTRTACASEVLAPDVRDLDGQRLVAGRHVHAADHELVAQPAGQRLADGELHGGGQDRVVGVEHQVEQAAAELRLVHPLARRGEQHLDDLPAQIGLSSPVRLDRPGRR